MLNKLYEQGKDLHVANYVAYGKTADHKLNTSWYKLSEIKWRS